MAEHTFAESYHHALESFGLFYEHVKDCAECERAAMGNLKFCAAWTELESERARVFGRSCFSPWTQLGPEGR